jgi:hypothetical protein
MSSLNLAKGGNEVRRGGAHAAARRGRAAPLRAAAVGAAIGSAAGARGSVRRWATTALERAVYNAANMCARTGARGCCEGAHVRRRRAGAEPLRGGVDGG